MLFIWIQANWQIILLWKQFNLLFWSPIQYFHFLIFTTCTCLGHCEMDLILFFVFLVLIQFLKNNWKAGSPKIIWEKVCYCELNQSRRNLTWFNSYNIRQNRIIKFSTNKSIENNLTTKNIYICWNKAKIFWENVSRDRHLRVIMDKSGESGASWFTSCWGIIYAIVGQEEGLWGGNIY